MKEKECELCGYRTKYHMRYEIDGKESKIIWLCEYCMKRIVFDKTSTETTEETIKKLKEVYGEKVMLA